MITPETMVYHELPGLMLALVSVGVLASAVYAAAAFSQEWSDLAEHENET